MDFDIDKSKTYLVTFANHMNPDDRFTADVEGSNFEQVKNMYASMGYEVVIAKPKK